MERGLATNFFLRSCILLFLETLRKVRSDMSFFTALIQFAKMNKKWKADVNFLFVGP